MSKDTESQHSEASPQPTPGPWTRLLLAAHAVLEPWDGGVLFDENPPTVAEVMNALAAATAATDLQEAAKADAAPDLLAALKKTVKWFPPDDAQMALTRAAVLAAIAEAEPGQP